MEEVAIMRRGTLFVSVFKPIVKVIDAVETLVNFEQEELANGKQRL